MKIAFIVIWALSNGQIQGDPWQWFASIEECEVYSNENISPVTEDRLRFLTACVDTAADVSARAFHFTFKQSPHANNK